MKNEKDISGCVYSTEKMINQPQNLYKIALLQNKNKTLNEMEVAVGAALYHSI